MRIDKILAGIKETQGAKAEPKPAEKTASAAPAVTSAPREALVAALQTATTPAPEKTASAAPANPVEDVMKVAAEIAETEKQAALNEARVLAEAFADTVIAKIATWQKAAQEMLAVAAPAASQDQLKQAMEFGYKQAQEELQKLAETEYNTGWNETVEAIYKGAAEEFLKAAAITAELCEAAKA